MTAREVHTYWLECDLHDADGNRCPSRATVTGFGLEDAIASYRPPAMIDPASWRPVPAPEWRVEWIGHRPSDGPRVVCDRAHAESPTK